MTSPAFQAALAFVLAREGGFSRDWNDPGNWTGGTPGRGELRGTNCGISAAAFPARDIEHLTADDITALYHDSYWTPVRGDDMPPPVALALFDAAVNQGLGTAARLLQCALGVDQDGDLGPQTMAAVAASEPRALLAELIARRAWRYSVTPTYTRFGLGWQRRVALAHAAALSLAQGTPTP